MESRFKPTKSSSGGVDKKQYFDKTFKKNLVTALKANFGEPNNIDKIRGNKVLKTYPAERITEYVSTVSADIQRKIDEEEKNPETLEIMKLTNFVNMISGEEHHELPFVLKMISESKDVPYSFKHEGVNFRELHHFLYSAVSGLPDCSNLNDSSKLILLQTHQMLLKQVENDATPEFLEELKSKLFTADSEEVNHNISDIAKIFEGGNLNPMNFPFTYLLNGTVPSSPEKNSEVEPHADETVSNQKTKS